MEPLFSVSWLGVAQVHVTDLKGRAQEVSSGIQRDSVMPTDDECVDGRLGLGSSRPQLVLAGLRIVGDEALKLANKYLDFRASEKRGHDHKALFVESTNLIRCRASANADLLHPIGAYLKAHGQH
jgi:hypothetical protein